MRLIVRKLWRAFPELDPFSDQQCRLFLRSARRTRRHMVWGNGLLASAFVFSLLMVGGLTFALFYHMRDGEVSWWPQTWRVLVSGGGFAVAAFGLLRLRDRTLRRSVLHLFATRGSCEACGHAMSGLPIPEDGLRCPECGHRKVVLESERTLDEAGRVRFLPRPEGLSVHDPWRFGSKVRRLAWRATLAAISVVALAIAVVAVMLSINEARNRTDAKAAAADLAALPATASHSAEVQRLAVGLSQLDDLLNRMPTGNQAMNFADEVARRPDVVLNAYGVSIEVSSILGRAPADIREAARGAMRDNAAWRLTAEVVHGQGALPQQLAGDSEARLLWREPPTALVFAGGHLMALCMSVMYAEQGEWERAAEMLIEADLICRRFGSGQSLDGVLCTQRMQLTQTRVLHRLLAERPPAQFLERIANSSMLGEPWTSDQALADEAYRSLLSESVAAAFVDPAALRWLPFADPSRVTSSPSNSPAGILARMGSSRLGRYQHHRQAMQRTVDDLKNALAGVADPPAPLFLPPSGSHLVDRGEVMLSFVLRGAVRLRHDMALARVVLAGERFEVREGRRPKDLQELLSSSLCAHGLGTLQRVEPAIKLAAAPMADGRLVTVIYHPGPDGVDNGGGADDVVLFPSTSLAMSLGVPLGNVRLSPDRPVFVGTRPR